MGGRRPTCCEVSGPLGGSAHDGGSEVTGPTRGVEADRGGCYLEQWSCGETADVTYVGRWKLYPSVCGLPRSLSCLVGLVLPPRV